MSIRNWDEKDLESIASLLKELNDSIGVGGRRLIDEKLIQEHYDEMSKYPEIYECYVYEKGGEIIGFISLIFYRTVFHKVGTALINELVVNEGHRNQQVGKKLLKYAINKSSKRGIDEIEVGVMKNNENAIRFYKRNGLNEEYYLLGLNL